MFVHQLDLAICMWLIVVCLGIALSSQDVPNNATPSDNIDNLKKDAVQHDGMNNGESVAPATAAVAV